MPEFSDHPEAVYNDAGSVIEELVLRRPRESHRIYWLRPDNTTVDHPSHSGHVFFTTDGALILGLSVGSTEFQRSGNRLLQGLAETADAAFGYCVFEEPPAESAVTFQELARGAGSPALSDEQLR